jgi:hypothetical protein
VASCGNFFIYFFLDCPPRILGGFAWRLLYFFLASRRGLKTSLQLVILIFLFAIYLDHPYSAAGFVGNLLGK